MAAEDYFEDDLDLDPDPPAPPKRPINHGMAWSQKDDAYLIASLKRKWPLEALAHALGRSLAGIECRIEWLATREDRKKKLNAYIARLIKGKRS